ncbi:hypothetical protein Tco_0949519 [Tanacetum coccineum]
MPSAPFILVFFHQRIGIQMIDKVDLDCYGVGFCLRVKFFCRGVAGGGRDSDGYVVPTGRVIATVRIKVLTGRYIVPAGYIISPGLKDLSRAETYKWYQSLERVSVEE